VKNSRPKNYNFQAYN